MAEDTAKLEESGIETMLKGEPNGASGQEDEQKSAVEELIDESGDGIRGTTEDGASRGDDPQKGKGWITNLPVELRDGVDTDRYHSLADYIKGLREEISSREPKPEPETDDAWSALAEELGKGDAAGEPIAGKDAVASLRAAGLTTKQAKEVYGSMQSSLDAYADRKGKEIRDGLLGLQRSIAGDDPGKVARFKSTLKRGMDAVAKANPELYSQGLRDSAFLHPSVAGLLYMVGLSREEGYSPAEKPAEHRAEGTTRDNPFGLK